MSISCDEVCTRESTSASTLSCQVDRLNAVSRVGQLWKIAKDMEAAFPASGKAPLHCVTATTTTTNDASPYTSKGAQAHCYANRAGSSTCAAKKPYGIRLCCCTAPGEDAVSACPSTMPTDSEFPWTPYVHDNDGRRYP